MFIVSDLRNGEYRISAMFTGVHAKERANRWAKCDPTSKVTQIRSMRIWEKLNTGMKLPARYTSK